MNVGTRSWFLLNFRVWLKTPLFHLKECALFVEYPYFIWRVFVCARMSVWCFKSWSKIRLVKGKRNYRNFWNCWKSWTLELEKKSCFHFFWKLSFILTCRQRFLNPNMFPTSLPIYLIWYQIFTVAKISQQAIHLVVQTLFPPKAALFRNKLFEVKAWGNTAANNINAVLWIIKQLNLRFHCILDN